MKKPFIFIGFVLLFIRCDNKENFKFETIESFPVDKEIVGEFVELKTMPNCPNNVIITGKYLVLLNYKDCDTKYFHVYDKNSFQLIGSFGTSGK